MATHLSMIKPTGRPTLGNLLGALHPARAGLDDLPDPTSAVLGVADLHALTLPHDPARLRVLRRELMTLLVAVGLDRATLFVQSRVPAHARLGQLLESVATTGELGRMVQYKELTRQGAASARTSLLTYPVLMAADILLHAPRVVPVGDDQRQHVELTRDLAQRFNATYGSVLTVPEIATPAVAARVMDLADPTRKMGKSDDRGPGVVLVLDPPDVVRRKVARAVTDSDVGPDAVRADRATKPGVTNLLEVLEACGGSPAGVTTYGALKRAVTDAVVATLEPVQRRYADLVADPTYVEELYAAGEARCRELTAPVLGAVEAAMGLS